MKTSSCFLVAAAAFVLIPSCTAQTGSEEATGEVSEAQKKCEFECGPNGLTPSCFWLPASQDALRQLGAHSLLSAPQVPNLPWGCRQEILQHAVECALTSTQSITDPLYPTLTYTGHWGLAPAWLNAPLTTDGARWVTACMGQRLNAFGAHVNIVLEGNTPPIYTDADFEQEYTFDESTAWGNLFSPHLGPFQLNVCWDQDFARACGTSPPSTWLTTRICYNTPSADCGLNIVGPCAGACIPGASGYPTCRRSSNVSYDDHTVHVQLEPRTTCFPSH